MELDKNTRLCAELATTQELPAQNKNSRKNDFMTYLQVVEEFGINKSSLYRLKKAGLVQWTKLPGTSCMFSRKSIEELINQHTTRSVAEVTPKKATPKKSKAHLPSTGYRFL